MSHFTHLQTQMTDLELVKKALDDLGFAYEVGAVRIRGYREQETPALVKIETGVPGYDIGLRPAGRQLELIADWHGLKRLQNERFAERLLQRYAYHATCEKLRQQGFELVSEQHSAEDDIRLVLRRIA